MKSVRELLDSPELHSVVRRRWAISLVLTAALFVAYYGFILLVALDKELLARRLGEVTTLGIPLGVGVIVLAWVLTVLYVLWANGSYDRSVAHLRAQLKED
jgi:uncharacterized membrane protein (DUF485 family)